MKSYGTFLYSKMIELYTGLIGSGKTYSTVRRMVEYISEGGCVVTNIRLNLENLSKKLSKDYGWTLQEGQVIYLEEGDKEMARFHVQVPEGSIDKKVLVCIDEASEWLDAYNYSKADSELMTFLRQSRKVFVDVIFIVQDQSLVNKRVRTLCQWVWWHIDVRTWRLPVIKLAIPLPMIMQMQFDKFNNMVNRQWEWIEFDIFGIYDSFQVYRAIGLKQGVKTKFKKIMGVDTMSKGWKFAVVMSYICVALMFLLVRRDLKDGKKIEKESVVKTELTDSKKVMLPESTDQKKEEVKADAKKEPNWLPVTCSNYWYVEKMDHGKPQVIRGVWANGREYIEGKRYALGECIAVNDSTVAFADAIQKRIFFLKDLGLEDKNLLKSKVVRND